MARRKKPENETTEQARIRRIMETVADFAPRSDKVAWQRKYSNMQGLIEEMEPINLKIQDLIAQRQPMLDEIAELRRNMVQECIHPYDSLEYVEGNTVLCKFCNRTIVVTNADGK